MLKVNKTYTHERFGKIKVLSLGTKAVTIMIYKNHNGYSEELTTSIKVVEDGIK